ncbi:glycine--tRNA ligase subunit beta [Asticcacaulis sp. 201]|uniref:glycine--tRNA ligase subunit beta n=1 Tax=Asticcacaulis sp. 201 TaxID=3028787 RepID=UPI0029170C71|nr:glycine--tRNA ligase subunit beta [Asticcacaulis sp. 201]MDV6329579.1 glycine--tRNA ligase subunit beta [Asticcacaulis sp. 201]
MAQLLIELFSEEIPARMQLGAARDFERLFGAKLTAAGLSFATIKAYVGPRRLALHVEGLPTQTAAVTEDVKGPKESAPPQAMEGFLRKVGLTQDKLKLENGIWMARIEKPGVKTADVLGEMLRDVILAFPWPKSMRSGTSTFRWVRPLKRILFLFDGQVIPFELEGLRAANLTEGHRFLGSGQALPVTDFDSYKRALADNSVILDHADRQAIILDKARAVCAEAGCELIEDQGLLEEVAGLNEFPVPLLGDMDPQFLTLPPEVIKTSMRTHQKYFAVRDAGGKMAAKFVITANMQASDGGAEIKRGNAKVLSARLSDGVFFWKEDNRAGNFDQWLTKLKGVTFHAKLGTMAQRVARIVALAHDMAPLLGANANTAAEAARLAKADLASHMVGEFPELQGVMGGYYADAAMLDPAIADAIRQHYKPQGPSDSLPDSAVSAAVALADKLDTLIGFFAINEKPTGSKDPFALRRSALGILRILRHFNVRVSLADLAANWYRTLLIYAGEGRSVYVDTENWRGSAGPRWAEGHTEVYKTYLEEFSQGLLESPVWVRPTDRDYDLDLMYEHVPNVPEVTDAVLAFRSYAEVGAEFEDFMADRLRVQLKDDGVRFDVIEAVFALKDGDVVRLTRKIEALETVLKTPKGDDLLAAHKRVANILAAEAKKGALPKAEPHALPGAPDVEIALIKQINVTRRSVDAALDQEKYIDALQEIAAMRQGVDAFLEGVLVNAEDAAIRNNRLAILRAVCDLSGEIADLSKIA